MISIRRCVAAALLWIVCAVAPAFAADAAGNVTPVESLLFETNHLDGLALPAQLDYRYTRDGEAPVEDHVVLTISRERKVEPEYLSGDRHVNFPPVEGAQSNPLLLYFLESDLRDMARVTGGRSGYFRRLIRLALADSHVAIQATEVAVGGRTLAASRIVIEPYRSDPMAPVRYPTLAGKRYEFVLAPKAPGQIVLLSTTVPLASGRTVTEKVELIGATPRREQ